MPRINWRATATLDTLKKRADLLKQIRSFFNDRAVMEVDTPVLGESGVTDLHLNSVAATVNTRTKYLQTSPEYYMKRLLAQGVGPIYYLGKVFRDEEYGSRHLPEFTLLEWYRPGWDERQLMAEISELFSALIPYGSSVISVSYRQVFEQSLGLNPHSATLVDLSACAGQRCGGDWAGEGRSTLLDLLFSQIVEPDLPDGLVFVHDYPACQSALAKLDKNESGETIARRFELFFNGMELGNGYFELTDAVEQKSRFKADLALRAAAGMKPMTMDDQLLAAMESGLPECAGVAIGVDRLLMQVLGKNNIAEVVPFGRDLC